MTHPEMFKGETFDTVNSWPLARVFEAGVVIDQTAAAVERARRREERKRGTA